MKNKAQRKPRFVVTKDGVDCGWGLKKTLGPNLRYARGVLIPQPNDPHYFAGEKSAMRAIARTEKTATVLRGSMVDQMPALEPVLRGGVFGTRLAT